MTPSEFWRIARRWTFGEAAFLVLWFALMIFIASLGG